MFSVGLAEESFPDKRLSKLASGALLLFCFLESLLLFSSDDTWTGLLYLPASIYALFSVRLPAKKLNQKRTIGMFAFVAIAVSLSAYFGQNSSEGLSLVIVASFILLTPLWAVVYSLLSLLVVLALNFLLHNDAIDSFFVVRSMALSLAVMALSYALVSRLLVSRREANLCRRVDIMTGLGNRSALVEEMASAVEGFRRYSLDISAICIRTNQLESWQAEYGAAKCALVLEELVSIWESRIRNTDSLFRYGNDVFVVLLPNTSQKSASKLESDLRRASEVYDFSHGQAASLDVTVCAVRSGQTWEQWLSEMLCISQSPVSR